MPASSSHITAKPPISVFSKPLRADFKGLFRALAAGVGHSAVGKWEQLGNDAVEVLGSIGLTTDPGELATLLAKRALVRASFDITGEMAGLYLADTVATSFEIENEQEILDSITDTVIDNDFLLYPERLPLVERFQILLRDWLIKQSVPSAPASALTERFPSYFVYALNREWRKNPKDYKPLLEIITTPFTKAGDRELAWAAYASFLDKRIHEGIFDETFSLAQLYVPLNAYFLDSSWSEKTADATLRLEREEKRIVVPLQEELEAWLERNDKFDAIRVISGGPGSGKSSFARVFAAKLSNTRRVRVLFVPLHLIDPARSLVDEIGRFVLDEGILKENPLAGDSHENNLLVIFDGLDELASQGKAAAETARAFIREIDRTIEKLNVQQPRLRVIISGRELVIQENESEFRKVRQILILLPYYVPSEEHHRRHALLESGSGFIDEKQLLAKDLRNEWWVKYGRLTGLGFSGLPTELDRPDLAEVTAQPLLNYLVALSYVRGKLSFSQDINLNFIYSDLVEAVYQRGYERRRTYGPIRHMSFEQFSRVLEEIGLAAWHGDGRTTTIKEIEDHCRLSGVGTLLESFREGAEAGVTKLLAAFFFRQHGRRPSGDPTFVFTHKSFGEYLTAKRVIRAAERMVKEVDARLRSPDQGWDEPDALRHWVQVCGPNSISPYLYTFLRNEVRVRKTELIANWQEHLTDLFSYILRYSIPMELSRSLADCMFKSRNAEEALLVTLNACACVTQKISEVEHPSPTAFGAWFRRIQGQRSGAESCLAARCLSYLNLSSLHLDIVDFYSSNLCRSNLEGTTMNLTCLQTANLKGAKLKNAVLWRANLNDANLEEVDFHDVRIDEKDLEGAELTPIQRRVIQFEEEKRNLHTNPQKRRSRKNK